MPSRHPPTKKEAEYLYYLKVWTQRMGRPPWVHELAGWLGKSQTAIYSAMISLEHKGWVGRSGGDPTKRADRRFVAVDE